MKHKLARGESLVISNEPDHRNQKFRDFAWQWYDTYAKNNNKRSEVSRKLYTLRGHLVPFFGATSLDKINTLQVERYKSEKIKSGLANKTVNNHLTVLGICLRTAQDWYGLERMPKIKKLKTPPLSNEFLPIEHSRLLLAHTQGLWHEIVLMALKTGLRVGELKALRWSDINWNNGTLTVRHSWCEVMNALDTPKSNRTRHVPLSEEVLRMLMQKDISTDFVFVDEHGRRFNTKRLNYEIGRACRAAGIGEVTCHTLRHTFASHLVIAGVSLKAVQELLGHAQIQMTMRYAHIAESDLRNAVARLESLEREPYNFGQPVGNAPQSSIARAEQMSL